MSKLMAEGGGASGAAETQGKESIGDSGASSEAMKVVNEYIDKEIEALSKELQESGLKPEEFLQNLIAEAVSAGAQSGSGKDATSSTGAAAGEGGGEQRSQEKLSFQDTIRRTMERMQESGDRAASAAAAAGEDDLLAQMLKALEQGAQGAGDGGDLDKMIMGMMEQLSNKEMLYEPMKELDGKFRPWLRDNRDKCSPADLERYERQARIVGEIVRKFEEPDYADDKPECRSFIWDRMQEVSSWLCRCRGARQADGETRCKLLGIHPMTLLPLRLAMAMMPGRFRQNAPSNERLPFQMYLIPWYRFSGA